MISQKRYVDITSGVGAGAAVATRQLILRIVSVNENVAPGSVYEFTTPEDVATLCGQNSEEYRRAVQYFGFISKSIRAPKRLSMVRYVFQPYAATIYGAEGLKDVQAIKALTAPELDIKTTDEKGNVNTVKLTGFQFTNSNTPTDVASEVQRIMHATTGVPQLGTNSYCTYNTNNSQYKIQSAIAGKGKIEVVKTGNTDDLSGLMGLIATGGAVKGAIVAEGLDKQAPVQAISESAAADNNFGSFLFTYEHPTTDDETIAIAKWNKSQNNMYMFLSATDKTNIDLQDGIDNGVPANPAYGMNTGYAERMGISGWGQHFIDVDVNTNWRNEFIEQAAAEILAATDYDATNATQNYMFYQFPDRSASVKENDVADWADAHRLNYIGQTQTAGQKLAFYQRGVLFGGPNDALDMNIYANEMWLKDYISANMLTAFLALPTIPANEIGKAMLLAILQASVDKAKDNGVISVGKTLNTIKQLYITRLSGDEMAWRQVATLGYWFSVEFEERQNPNDKSRTEWIGKYILIYGKDDAIRKVEGQDVLM